MTTISDVQKLEAGAVWEGFILDMTEINGETLRFHAGTNEFGGDVIYQGETYQRWPIEAKGFDYTSDGPLPRPVMRVSNVDPLIAAFVADDDDLIGAKITRKRAFVKYLDAVNFDGGNPDADPNDYFEDDIYYIDGKNLEDDEVIEFQLASSLDMDGVVAPSGIVLANMCPSEYRGEDCGYAGGPVADENDNPTSDPALDKCGKRLHSCELREWPNGVLRFGSFPAAGMIR